MPYNTPGNFEHSQSALEQPAKHLVSISPNDSTDLSQPVRGIYVGGGGDLVLVAINDADGATQTLTAIPQGTFVPVITKRVMATNTTASQLIGLW